MRVRIFRLCTRVCSCGPAKGLIVMLARTQLIANTDQALMGNAASFEARVHLRSGRLRGVLPLRAINTKD